MRFSKSLFYGGGAGSKATTQKKNGSKKNNGSKKGSSPANNDYKTTPSTTTKPMDDHTNTKKTSTVTQMELQYYVWVFAAIFVFYKVLAAAYDIRLISIKEFGPVIHEYDPYFNYRATEVSAQ
jgi:hypothetical protein